MTVSKKLFLITEFYDSSQNTTGYLFGKLYEFLSKQKDIDITLLTKKDEGVLNQPEALYVKGLRFDNKSLVSRSSHELLIGFNFFIYFFLKHLLFYWSGILHNVLW